MSDKEGVKTSDLKDTLADTGSPTRTQDKPTVIPYDRFKEVVGEKNDAIERIKALEQREQELSNQLNEKGTLIDRIRGLAADEKAAPYVFFVDKALKFGVDSALSELQESLKSDLSNLQDPTKGVEMTKEETKPEDKLTEVTKKIENLKTEATELVAEKNAEVLWELAKERASKYLEGLPEEYTEQDKSIISEMWTPRVDWTKIESDPSTMNAELARGLQNALKVYGAPKGAVAREVAKEVEIQKPKEPTIEERIAAIKAKEFSKLDDKGNPLMSDEEFIKDAGQLLRLEKQLRAGR